MRNKPTSQHCIVKCFIVFQVLTLKHVMNHRISKISYHSHQLCRCGRKCRVCEEEQRYLILELLQRAVTVSWPHNAIWGEPVPNISVAFSEHVMSTSRHDNIRLLLVLLPFNVLKPVCDFGSRRPRQIVTVWNFIFRAFEDLNVHLKQFFLSTKTFWWCLYILFFFFLNYGYSWMASAVNSK